MTMAWILQAVGGGESIGVYIKDVKGGNKTFVRTMIGATIAVGIMYILGAVAVGLVVPTDVLKGNFSNGIFDIFKILGTYFHIPANDGALSRNYLICRKSWFFGSVDGGTS